MIIEIELARFERWIRTREEARRNKEAGAPRPWTDDPIINSYHFCNVRREDDRVTKELRALAQKHYVTAQLPTFYTMARMFNHAPSVEFIIQNGWEAAHDHFLQEIAAGRKVYHTAYVVSTAGSPMTKSRYIQGVVQQVGATHVPASSLRAAHAALCGVNGLGSFLAGQVVADLKNDRYLEDAEDWWEWSCIGPGSKKGLDILFGGRTSPVNYHIRMSNLFASLSPDIQNMGIHMQDLQNCLCEFSKYHNYLSGGSGRTRYYRGA